MAAALVGAPAAFAINQKTGSEGGALAALVGAGVAGALLCRERGSRYTVFIERVIKPGVPVARAPVLRTR